MPDNEQVPTAEVIASLCLATDLGMGFPFELGLRATLAAMRLCDVLDVDPDTASQTYYACLLMHSGCLVDAETRVEIFHGNSTETGYHRLFGSPLEGVAGAVAAIPSPDARWSQRAHQLAVGIPKAVWVRRDIFTAYCEVAERGPWLRSNPTGWSKMAPGPGRLFCKPTGNGRIGRCA